MEKFMSNNPYNAPQSNVSLGAKEENYCEIRLFSTEARLGRLRYFNRLCVVSYNLTMLVSIFAFIIRSKAYERKIPVFGWMHPNVVIGIFAILFLLLLATLIFAVIQRLHDTNHSGWFALLLLIPAINVVLGIALLFIPSSTEPNNFGSPPPKNTRLTYAISGLFVVLFLWNTFGRSLRKLI